MKKILIGLCLVLTLCLLTGAALAYTPTTDDDYIPSPDTDTWDDHDPDSEIAGIPYEEVYRVHEYKFMDSNGEVQTHFVGDEGVYIIKEPTHTEKGIVRYVCSEPTNDGVDDENDPDFDPPKHFHEQFIKPLGHNWKWKIIKEPTCVDTGLREQRCSCGAKGIQEVIPALGHIMTSDWDNWTDAEKEQFKPWDYSLVVDPMSSENNYEWYWGRVLKLPTCTETGLALDFCPRCGFEGDTRVIEKLPHQFRITNWVEPNCLDVGYEWQECVWCGCINMDYDAEDAYDVGDVAVAYHYDYHWAIVDGETYYDWVEYKHDDYYAEDDNVGDGYRVLAQDRFNHDWDNWVVLQDSTCHEEGFKLHWCKRCGDKAEVVIEKKDPVWVPLDSRLINCYVREVTFYCALCNPNGIDQKHLKKCDHEPYTVQFPVVSHVWANRVIEDPWCEEEGLGERYCIYEDEDWHDPDTWLGNNPYGLTEDDYAGLLPLYEVEQYIIPELGHQWGEWVLRYGQYFKDENDNEFGYWLRECERHGYRKLADADEPVYTECHKTEERVSYFPPEDPTCEHDWVELWIDTEPTCEGTGLRRIACTKCKTEKWEEIPATGQEKGEAIIVKEPGCTEAGHYIYVCTKCDATFDEYPEAVGHVEITVPAVPAKCFEDGTSEYVMCEACGATLVEPSVIPAIGYHDYQKIAAVEPTCEADGNTEGVVCTVCGDVMIEAKVIPAIGHNYVVEPGKAATCEEAGYTQSEVCANCGDVKAAKEEIPALGHDWGEWAVTTEPTTEAEGVETRVCKNDASHTETRPIEKLEKDPFYTFVGDPEIDDKGWFTGKVEHDETTKTPPYAVVRVSMYLPGGDVITSFSLVRTDMSFKVQFPASMLGNALGYAAQVMAEVENPTSAEAVFYSLGINWAAK